MEAFRKSWPRPGNSSSPVVLMPWRQSISVPKQSNVSQWSAIFCRKLPGLGQVLLDGVRQVLHGHGLQPDAARSGQRRQEQSRAAEEGALDPWNRLDVELNRFLVHADVPRVHAERVARLQVVRDHL